MIPGWFSERFSDFYYLDRVVLTPAKLAESRRVGRAQALQSFLLGIRGSIAPFIGSATVRPSGTTPMPDVVMKIWSPLPRSSTLVSPVTSRTVTVTRTRWHQGVLLATFAEFGDRNDAEAIATAARQGNMRFVAVKSVEQQARLSWHRVREGYKVEALATANRPTVSGRTGGGAEGRARLGAVAAALAAAGYELLSSRRE